MKKLLRLHENDNVGLVLEEILAGETCCESDGASWQAVEPIPRLHKIAIVQIPQGAAILKYGQTIGYAIKPITTGEHVHSHNCSIGAVNKDYGFCRNAHATNLLPLSQQRSFHGFRRSNGRAGTRNYVGILTTVNCSATVAKQIAAHFASDQIMAEWPNVDGVVALTHDSGCGMQGQGEGYDTLRRTFEGYLRHPNFGSIMLVGLGCETMQINKVLHESGFNSADTVFAYNIQDTGGTRLAIEKGIAHLQSILPIANKSTREPIPASELSLAVQCGGSDALSGVSANPALGIAGDMLIENGGTVIYSETPEIYGAEHLLTQRASTPEVAENLLARVRWWENYTSKNGFELDNNPSPGNKQGGLTTILEKSLGAQAKSGSTTMKGVFLYAEPIVTKGLVFMDSPGFDPVSVTGQVASGANIICFTTGRGSAFGYKPVPSIKLASNSSLFTAMQEDIDINCGTVVDGNQTMEQCGTEIFERILSIASGEKTKSEQLGYGDTEFTPWKIGAVM
ncbi:UxaA family hydrolase [Teredinibacter purpureus]|uniref:UxaA family hydrolase n=1 Tax=Teredinibacter purpureus TaxID=2731756 RepID=UPI0005F83F6A|nr:altronate dehydratase family protein [Teredinibacter purpureus]